MQKDRITLGVCTNVTGTDRLKLVVIHTAAKPRDFGNLWKPSDHVDYFHNRKAWMTIAIFDSWIKSVNSRMASQGKSIVMLMDNASSHDIPSVSATEQHGLQTIKLTNVLVVFLPANTTSHVQPLDAGIIAAFKAHYKAHMLRWYIEQYEATETDKDLAMLMPGVRQAILWSVAAFGELSNQTISNCWRKTDILPPVWNAQLVNADEREKTRVAEANAELSSLIANLRLGSDALSAEEFQNFPNEEQVSCLHVLFGFCNN